uniref:Nf-kappa-b-repressing factor n=1 Tax=Triatoma infestans TaxID=30076 RepID=A0A161MQI0_TRIIF
MGSEKKFLLAHKDKYAEDRLVCLAQLFCNVYFLGCKYAEPVMELLDSLSKGITEKNQKWENQTFVLASSAVEEKIKARIQPEQQTSGAKNPVSFVQGSNLNTAGSFQDTGNNQSMQDDGKKKSEVWVRGQKRPGFGIKEGELGPHPSKMVRLDTNDPNQNVIQESSMNYGFERRRIQFDIRKVVESGPFGKVVVFQSALTKEENPISVIERTASAAHMTTSFDFRIESNGVTCKLSLDGLYLATGQGWSQKLAKETACKVAIERLKETSFTIIVKATYIGTESVVRGLSDNNVRNKESASVDIPIADSNIGSKMLKLMGWSGGGLGKNRTGNGRTYKAL